jgi:pyrimidine deaminase RibD-like protein
MGGEHEALMREALHEGLMALPGCLPNPPVGCVIVLNGQVLARGYTSPPGHPHAEAMALQRLAHPAARASVYVTLEPCSFDGRTPSCAEVLVAAGVGRVIVGIIDPHPRNRGRGIEILRKAGIPVEVGVLANEVEAVLAPYLIRE